jgi:nitrogen fixation NifU-like protein
MMTELIEDQTVDELKHLGKDALLDALGLEHISPARMRCAMLSLRVLHQALGNDWFGLAEEEHRIVGHQQSGHQV